jgi:hypothetical protein
MKVHTISYSLSILTESRVCSRSLCKKIMIHSIPLRSIVLSSWPRSDDTRTIFPGPNFTFTVLSGRLRLHSAAANEECGNSIQKHHNVDCPTSQLCRNTDNCPSKNAQIVTGLQTSCYKSVHMLSTSLVRTACFYTRKNAQVCYKSVHKLLTRCIRTACHKLSTGLEQRVDNFL